MGMFSLDTRRPPAVGLAGAFQVDVAELPGGIVYREIDGYAPKIFQEGKRLELIRDSSHIYIFDFGSA